MVKSPLSAGAAQRVAGRVDDRIVVDHVEPQRAVAGAAVDGDGVGAVAAAGRRRPPTPRSAPCPGSRTKSVTSTPVTASVNVTVKVTERRWSDWWRSRRSRTIDATVGGVLSMVYVGPVNVPVPSVERIARKVRNRAVADSRFNCNVPSPLPVLTATSYRPLVPATGVMLATEVPRQVGRDNHEIGRVQAGHRLGELDRKMNDARVGRVHARRDAVALDDGNDRRRSGVVVEEVVARRGPGPS